jgi:hypothetical protein
VVGQPQGSSADVITDIAGEETDHAVLTPLLDVDGFVREQNTRLTGADSL